MSRRPRLAALAVAAAVAAVAAPSAQAAALPNSMDMNLKLGKGRKTVAWDVTTVGGALEIRLDVSNVTYPGAQLRIGVRPPGGTETGVINTRTGLNCQGAAGSVICEVSLDASPGTYHITLTKRTTRKVRTHVETSWS